MIDPGLPRFLTPLVGRERELNTLARLLLPSDVRLLTLSGPAGGGKTRLAAAAATRVRGAYDEGPVWVDLTRITGNSPVSQAVARAVGAKEEPGRSVQESLVDFLGEKQLLLILDNCEHVREACRQLVTALLADTAVSILATSRVPLTVTGERRYPVPPLSLPPRNYRPDDLAELRQFEAIRLFVKRAQVVLPAFDLRADNADAILSICRRLDGLPLPIELAAARINVLTVGQIAARLEDQFALLAPARHLTYGPHQTLWAAFDWSYDLLTQSEKLLLQRLSVFAGGCSLATAELVCSGEGLDRERMLDLLASLADRSLLTADTLRRDEARYTMLETTRQYARAKLQAAGDWPRWRHRHLQHFLQVAEEISPRLAGAHQRRWLDRLEADYDNLRAALRWSLDGGDVASGLRIAVALFPFWTIRGYAEEALAWLERLLARPDESVPPLVRADALAYAAFLSGFRGDGAAQAAYGREATDLAEALGAAGEPALAWVRAGEAYAHGQPGPLPGGGSPLAWALGAQAYGARAAGDYETELAVHQELIQLHREAGERNLLGVALIRAGFAATSLGNYEEARALMDEGLPLVREAENPYWLAMSLNGSGDLARCQGQYELARAHYQESIALLREIGATRDLASALHNLAYTCLRLGNVERAGSLFSESLALQRARQNTSGVAECLLGFAAVAAVRGLPALGARLLAAAVALGGERVATTWPATRMAYEHYRSRIRAGLTADQFRAEQAAGRTLSLEQAVALAHNLPLEVAARKERKTPADLTPRQREIAALVAQAKSNGEIAEELVLSKRTVEKHISNIRSRLGFTRRAQIVRWAVENGLVE